MQNERISDPYLEALEVKRRLIINAIITSIALALIPISAIVVYFGFRDGWGIIAPLQLAAILIIWFLSIRKHQFSAQLRAGIISVLVVGGATGEILDFGLIAPTFPLLAVLPVVATAIGGVRLGMLAFGVVCFAVVTAAFLVMQSAPVPSFDLNAYFFRTENWIVLLINIAVAAGIGMFVIGSLYNFQNHSARLLVNRSNELVKSKNRTVRSATLASLGHAVVDYDKDMILDCDVAFAEMHGLLPAEVNGLQISTSMIGNLIHEDDRDAAIKFREQLINGEENLCEFRHVLPGGEVKFLRKMFTEQDLSETKGAVFDVISRDVTEERLLQEKLFQAQKMDAIGKLTGGVAHDFNNLLAVILGNLELLSDEITDSKHSKLIQNGINATLRGSKLTQNMLSFAQQSQLEPTRVDLNHLVRNLHTWITPTIPSSIKVETSLLEGLWPTDVDAGSAESAMLNLIVNARDAMPDGGKLTIETSNVRIDDDYLELRGENVTAGRYVLLAVSDTGHGISAENLKHIFEPFFTTKPVGAGSGLGLPMLEGFMRQSGGTVRVYTEPEVGTTFKLYFPAAKDADGGNSTSTRDASAINPSGITKILLVEDDADVLKAIRTAISNAGFQVIVAGSGDEALKTFEQTPDIDMLLTDIVMPGELQGTMLAKALRAKRPELPVVFMSGYANEATVHGNGLRPEDIRLMKPVRRADLMQAIKRALALKSKAIK